MYTGEYTGSIKGNIETSQQSTNNTSMLQFPKDLGNYAMIFMFEEYDYSKTGNVVGKQDRNAAGSLVLPLPSNGLMERSNISLDQTNLGAIGAGIATAANVMGNDTIDKQNKLSTISSRLGISLPAWGNVTQDPFTYVNQNLSNKDVMAVASKLATRSIPGMGEGVSAGTGIALNNFTTLQFTGVNLRSHEFSWRFFPEDADESKILTNIRKKLMQAAHPSYSEKNTQGVLGRALLKYPLLVNAYILINDSETYYYQFKPCLIESVSMVFRAENGMILLKGGKPAVVELNMTLKETGIWIADEF